MQLIWTALPNGLASDGSPRLSVHLSPQLDFADGRPVGPLSEFEAFVDWPGHLAANGLEFSVVVDGSPAPIPARRIDDPQPSSALWRETFPATTLVRPRSMTPGTGPGPVSSYSAATVAMRVSRGYQSLGRKHPYRPASDAELGAEFDDLREALRERGTPVTASMQDAGASELVQAHAELASGLLGASSFDNQLERLLQVAARRTGTRDAGEPVMLVPPTDQPSSAFAQLAAFHRRRRDRPLRAAAEVPPKDFHQIVSALSEYRALQRLCGLVFDLVLDPGALPTSEFGAVRTLHLSPSLLDPPPGLSRTKYLHRADSASPVLPVPHFVAAPRKADDASGSSALGLELETLCGLVNLGIPRPEALPDGPRQYSLVQFDLDGAGLKLLSALGHPSAGDAESPGEPAAAAEGPADRGAPTLRTSGLSLMRERLGSALVERMDWASSQHRDQRRGEAPPLYAEDLTRGYRIDIREVSPDSAAGAGPLPEQLPWRSLHTRVGTLRLLRPADAIVPDVVTAEVAIDDEGVIQPAVVEDVSTDLPSPLYISEAVFHWQGWSLATPRPGNPVEPQDGPVAPPSPANLHGLPNATATLAPAAGSLPRLRFGRHYQVRLRTADIAGNGLDLAEADALLAGLRAAGRREPILPEKPVDFLFRRFDPVPPPVLVLRRGVTEGESPNVIVLRSTPGQSPAEYAAAFRDIRYGATAERHVVPPKASQLMAEQHGMLDFAFGAGGDPMRAYNIARRSTGSLNDAAIVSLVTGEREALPDVVLRDPATGADRRIENGLDRPAVEGTTSIYPVHYEEALALPYLPDPAAAGVAIFGLPGINGMSGRLNLVSGQIEWLDGDAQELPLDAQKQLGDLLRIGFAGTWPELPTFRLVVADAPGGVSRLPEWNPVARTLTVALPAGESRDIYLASYPDVASLPLFGLYQWWGDGIDPEGAGRFLAGAGLGALTMLTPQQKVTIVHATQRPVRLAVSAGGGLKPIRFNDQTTVYFSGAFDIHGPSTAKLDLTASWQERRQSDGDVQQLRAHLFEVPIYLEGAADPGTGDAPVALYTKNPASFRLASPSTAQQASDRVFPARQEFGDTRHRQVTFQLTATTRYSEHFPGHITADAANLTRTLEFEANVPSSASPPAPQPGSILPVFDWTEQFNSAQQLVTRRRGGGALRIELGPTWFASGDGEMLGLTDDMEWALDPLQAGPNPAGQMVKATAARIDVPGEDGVRPYKVAFDQVRRVFFADVTFDVERTYSPFVRFSMVRYQPNSLRGKCLSPRVDSGLHQLLPPRTVRLEYPPSGDATMRAVRLTVLGAWPGAALSPLPGRGHLVEVVLQQRPAGSASDADLGWSTADARPVAEPIDRASDILWAGEVRFPATSGTTQHRLLVQEFELYPSNEMPGQGWPGETDAEHARRLVYADTILL